MTPIVHIGPRVVESASNRMRTAGPLIVVRFRMPESDLVTPPCIALVDTGATTTCLDEHLAEAFGESYGEVAEVDTPQGSIAGRLMNLDLTVPQLDQTTRLRVLSRDLYQQGIHALLGRDFLADKVLIYDGKRGTVMLCR